MIRIGKESGGVALWRSGPKFPRTRRPMVGCSREIVGLKGEEPPRRPQNMTCSNQTMTCLAPEHFFSAQNMACVFCSTFDLVKSCEFAKAHLHIWSNRLNFTKVQQSDLVQSCEFTKVHHSHLVRSFELHQSRLLWPVSQHRALRRSANRA